MKRAAVILACLMLAACGGGGGGGAGDAKGKLKEAMKPCEDSNKKTAKDIKQIRSGKVTPDEGRTMAEEGVAACEKAQTEWAKIALAPEARKICMAEADARLAEAVSIRTALDHQVSKPYQQRIARAVEVSKKAAEACKEALAK